MRPRSHTIKPKETMANEQGWEMDPTKLPKTLDLELSAEAMEWLRTTAQQTGRCEDELILQILDRALQSREKTQKSGPKSPDSDSI